MVPQAACGAMRHASLLGLVLLALLPPIPSALAGPSPVCVTVNPPDVRPLGEECGTLSIVVFAGPDGVSVTVCWKEMETSGNLPQPPEALDGCQTIAP